MADSKTPNLDELEKGPWPSFATEIKKAAATKANAKGLMMQLERSYKEKRGHWKHGGIVGVKGYGGGVIGRYSDSPQENPEVAEFHTIRVNQPAGWFYNTDSLRKICDIWDKYGSGLTNFHGATGDVILLGTTTANLQPAFDELADAGFDLGGSGSALRTPSCCAGQARCEFACFDSMALCHELTMAFQNQLHRPMWPYKFKIKMSACGNDCVAAIGRSDFSVIGTWRDSLVIDQAAVKEYAAEGLDIRGRVCEPCPTKCLKFDEKNAELTVNAEECVRCMHCINAMPKAIAPGKERGATILVGGKAPIVHSPLMSWVIVPFMKIEEPFTEVKDLLLKIWEWWDENAKNRERLGETIVRKGMRNFLKAVELEAKPQMVFQPRANPFYFWWPDEINSSDPASEETSND
ncbi:MAG TPA: dissimilatory-type sulfite reductase subunit alpha [Symbiobacteriaceae bacterium]|jgi:sulfite reductase alpha subunit